MNRGPVSGKIVSFCDIYVTGVSELGIGISARTLGAVTGDEWGSDSNMMTNQMLKAPSKSIYICHLLDIFVNDSEVLT